MFETIWKTILQYLVKLKINIPLPQSFSVSLTDTEHVWAERPRSHEHMWAGSPYWNPEWGRGEACISIQPPTHKLNTCEQGDPIETMCMCMCMCGQRRPCTQTMSVCEQGDPAEAIVKVPTARKGDGARTRVVFTPAGLVMSGYLSTQRTAKTLYKSKQCEFKNDQEVWTDTSPKNVWKNTQRWISLGKFKSK